MKKKLRNWWNRGYEDFSPLHAKKCGYYSVEECPHTSAKDCMFDKADCHLLQYRKSRRQSDYTNLRIWVFILTGVVAYTFASIITENKALVFPYKTIVCNVISGISISVIAGAILSKVIDLPTRLKEYEGSFINALASNSYLKSLSEDRLTRLRNDITVQLHKAKAPKMAQGLINIDQKICELLRQPYYTRYRHSVICSPKANSVDYIVKEHTVEYQLVNPYSINKEATEYIKFSNLIMTETQEGQEASDSDAISYLKISLTKDDSVTLELEQGKDFILKSEHLLQPKTEYYNTKIWLDAVNKVQGDTRPGYRVDFKDNILVRIEYRIEVHVKDKCFTKRLQHAAKNFRIDYSLKGMEGQLFGQIFGTQLKQSDFTIKYQTNNSISLEAYDWLLPDNGAIVVLNTVKTN